MRLIMVLVLLMLGTGKLYADVNSNSAQLLIQEKNGTNAGRYRVIIFPNGSTVNNGDGSISVNFSIVPLGDMLLEDGTYLLLEDGSKMIL